MVLRRVTVCAINKRRRYSIQPYSTVENVDYVTAVIDPKATHVVWWTKLATRELFTARYYTHYRIVSYRLKSRFLPQLGGPVEILP